MASTEERQAHAKVLQIISGVEQVVMRGRSQGSSELAKPVMDDNDALFYINWEHLCYWFPKAHAKYMTLIRYGYMAANNGAGE